MFERPEYVCYRAAKPIVIDGKLDDASWEGAVSVDLALAYAGGEPQQRTTAKLLWDDDYLYVSFYCIDSDIWGITTERNKAIYRQEVVEVFVDADSISLCSTVTVTRGDCGIGTARGCRRRWSSMAILHDEVRRTAHGRWKWPFP